MDYSPPDDHKYVHNAKGKDRERIQKMAQRLRDLQNPSELLGRLTEVVRQVPESSLEVWPEVFENFRNDPMTIPAVDILMSRGQRPVPIVRDELLVPKDDVSAVMPVAAEYGLVPEPDAAEGADGASDDTAPAQSRPLADARRAPGVVRFVADPDQRTDLRGALRELERIGLPGGPNYIAALRNVAKGLDGPEYTDVEPDGALFDPQVGAEALVVIIDTGIDPQVADRDDPWLDDLGTSDVDPLDVFDEDNERLAPDGYLDGAAGHGTFVAGIVRQIAPGATVHVLRALDPRGLGTETAVAEAIEEASGLFAEHGGRGVLNLSLGFETLDGQPPSSIGSALKALLAAHPNVLVTAAAGNEPVKDPVWPAWFEDERILGVAALAWDENMNLVRADWSNTGERVDFSAVGDGVVSTYVIGEEHPSRDGEPETFPRHEGHPSYARWSGTSFSTPKVTALLAKLLVEHGTAEEALMAMRAHRDKWDGYGYIVRC